MSSYPRLIPQPVVPTYETLLAELPEHKRGQKDQLCRIYIEGKRAGSATLFGNNGPSLLQLLRWADSMGWGADTQVKVFRYSKASGTDSYLAAAFSVDAMSAVLAASAPEKIIAKSAQGQLFGGEAAA
jgi:hypothetical protein